MSKKNSWTKWAASQGVDKRVAGYISQTPKTLTVDDTFKPMTEERAAMIVRNMLNVTQH
jgi:hypothetical protein